MQTNKEISKVGLENQIKTFEEKYKKLKILENYFLIFRFCSTITGLVFIYLLACATQSGAFKKKFNLTAARIIEITALLLCVAGLALNLTEILHTNKKKAELNDELDNILSEKNNNTKDTNEDLQKKIVILTKIQQSLQPDNKLERSAKYLALTGLIIFTSIEVFAVIDLYIPFGLSTIHGKLPINFQGIVDTIGISLGLASVICILITKLENKKSDDKSEGKKIDWAPITLAMIPVVGTTINLIGKVIQGMQAAGSIESLKFDGGQIPLGFMIRIVSVVISTGLIIYCIGKTMDRSVDSEFKVDSYQCIGTGNEVS
jgi:hypothetical protein